MKFTKTKEGKIQIDNKLKSKDRKGIQYEFTKSYVKKLDDEECQKK